MIKGRGRAKGALNYRIESAPLPLDTMFRSELKQRTLNVTLNIDHPAFAALYRPLQDLEESTAAGLRTALELFLLSYARTSLQVTQDGGDMLLAWGATYGRMLQRS